MQYRTPTLTQLEFWLMTRLLCWLVMSALGCIVMSIVIVALHGEQAGLALLQAFIKQDYHYVKHTAENISILNNGLQAIPNTWSLPNMSVPMLSQNLQERFFASIAPMINGALLGTKLLILRLYLIVRWSPLFLLLGFVGLIDGLAQRAIRRASAGRESALVYHSAKPLIMLTLILGLFVGLVLPISTQHAEWLFVIAALLFGLSIQITTKRFKKYL
jgi:integrating conjugative element membrane protein (TIGR03747 family)